MAASATTLVSKDVIQGFTAAQRASVPSDAFAATAAAACAVLTGLNSKAESKLWESSAVKGVPLAVLKALFASISTVILECVKRSSSPATLGATLTDYGVSSDDATAVVRLYKEAHDGILQQLQSTGFSPASLVDVDWRLDYNVMTSGTGREHDPRYLMRLRALQSDGTPADVEFTCTSEQLRDMLNQAEGALRAVERLVGAQAVADGSQVPAGGKAKKGSRGKAGAGGGAGAGAGAS